MLVLARNSTYQLLKHVQFGEALTINSKRNNTVNTTNKSNIVGELDNFSFEVSEVLKDQKAILDALMYDNWGQLFTIDNLMNKRRLSCILNNYSHAVDSENTIYKGKKKGSSGSGLPIGSPIPVGVIEYVEVTYYTLSFDFSVVERVDLTRNMFKSAYPSLYNKYPELIDTLP